eukprot:841954_1
MRRSASNSAAKTPSNHAKRAPIIRCNCLLFWITFAISIAGIDSWKCQLYAYNNYNYGGTRWGPFDVGTWRADHGAFGQDTVSSVKLYSAGYHCYTTMYIHSGCSSRLHSIDVSPHGYRGDDGCCTGIANQDNVISCIVVSAVATPNPTPAPSGVTLSPTSSPTVAPTSSPTASPLSVCLDYKNETSGDGDNDIRFNHEHIINIDNYFANMAFVLHNSIECVGSDCVI